MTGRRRRGPGATRENGAAPPADTRGTWLARHGALLCVVAVCIFVAVFRLRLAGIPLERDEGEYAYGGQLLLQGIPPYVLLYSMKLPGAMFAYAAIMAVFGQDPWGIRVGLLLVNSASTIAMFFLGRRVAGDRAAAVAATAFALLTMDRWIMGAWAHATHFAIFGVLTGLLCLMRAKDSERTAPLVGAGLLLGAAIVMRQSAAAFVPFALLYLIWSQSVPHPHGRAGYAIRSTALVMAGLAMPVAIVAGAAVTSGVWDTFWLWTFTYPKAYVSEIPLGEGWSTFVLGWTTVTQATLPIWLLGLAGCVLAWLTPWNTGTRAFLTGLLIASAVALAPGFYFRSHYFIQLVPAVALGAGIAVVSLERLLTGRLPRLIATTIPLLLFAACAGSYLVTERDYLTSMTPREVTRSRYSLNPFVEAPAIGQYIRERTTSDDRIAVLGSEPEIYFYAGRRSATGFVYTYPFMEPQPFASRMQDDLIAEVEAARPTYVVVSEMHVSWMARPSSDTKVFRWMDEFTARCYELVGIADIQSPETSVILWDDAARAYEPRTPNVLRTFRRTAKEGCATVR